MIPHGTSTLVFHYTIVLPNVSSCIVTVLKTDIMIHFTVEDKDRHFTMCKTFLKNTTKNSTKLHTLKQLFLLVILAFV